MNDSRESARLKEGRPITFEWVLALLLLAGIFAVLALPTHYGRSGASGAAAARPPLFQVMESDFLQPKFASARAIHALNRVAGGLAAFGGYDEFTSCVRLQDEVSIANITRIAGDTLTLLDVRFIARSEAASSTLRVFISEAFWQRAFNRSPAALGATLMLHGFEYSIAGITRETSALLAKTDVWLPVLSRGLAGGSPCLRVIGGLRGELGWSQAQKQLVKAAGHLRLDFLQDLLATPRLIPLERGIYFGAPPRDWIAQHFPAMAARIKRAS